MKRKQSAEYLLAAAVALLTLLVYLPALQNEFVDGWDDKVYVLENPHIRSLNMDFVRWALFDFHAAYWHPLTWLSHAIDYALWRLNPFGHHLTNIILHAMNTFVVVLLIIRLLELSQKKRTDPGFSVFLTGPSILITAGVTGCLFGLHPLHVESVAWVAERKDLLCALFFLLSIMMYIKNDAHRAERGARSADAKVENHLRFTPCAMRSALCFFVLALLSKPMAVSLPVVFLILDWYPFNRIRSLADFRSALVEKIPFVALSFAASILIIVAQGAGGAMVSLQFAPLSTRALVAAKSLIEYLGKMVWPLDLVPFYPYPAHASPSSLEFIVPVALFVGITSACLWRVSVNKAWLAAWGYYVVTLIPVLGIVQVGRQAMADRFTYLPSLGPFLIMGLGTAWISRKNFFSSFAVKLGSGVIAVIVLGVMASLTIRQTGIWENSIVLWNYVIEKNPDGVYPAYNNRGMAFQEKGWDGKAIEDFSRAIALNPASGEPYYNRGLSFYNMGQLDQAIADYDESILLNPLNADAYNNRGLAFMKMGRDDRAIEDYNRAIQLNPLNASAYNNRGLAFMKMGRGDRAIEDYNRAIQLNPSIWQPYYHRGLSYESLGRLDEALADYEKVIVLNPLIYDAYYRRDRVMEAGGR